MVGWIDNSRISLLFISFDGGRSGRDRSAWFWRGTADVHKVVVEALDLLGQLMHGGFRPVEGVAVLPHFVEIRMKLKRGSILIVLEFLLYGLEVDWIFDYVVIVGSSVLLLVDWGQERLSICVVLDKFEDAPFLLERSYLGSGFRLFLAL